ncbi:MAG: KUP/HAK/KT family potassium transporter [Deltaproteobacteria bacterium]|nr:KUP/HAK/KT family potassium transporter [Nannocystaceae bacterium]
MDTKPAARAPSRALTLAALGVVFGDIGTAPLYAFNESMARAGSDSDAAVLGVLSLFFWSLTIVIAIKYVGLLSRADNQGEGGILALLALLPVDRARAGQRLAWTTLLVILGTALFCGDGVVAPAISVLSAFEGLRIASSEPEYLRVVDHAIVPATCVVLAALFAVQRRGTARIGRLFGRVMVLWFAVLALLGAVQVVQHPAVLIALSPHHAIAYLGNPDAAVLPVLGAVVLCCTGGEELYADIGHFGRRPIRIAWFGLVMPALVLNYFGQGALVLTHGAGAHSFWSLVPAGAPTFALVGLAAAATVIASQALISGSFSLARQAAQLGFSPRVRVIHTSRDTEGQIYVPEVNWSLAVACISLVLWFGDTSRLASAYGVAVSGTMLVSSIAFGLVAHRTWGWSRLRTISTVGVFVILELAFLVANLKKIDDGGWVPLAIGLVLFVVMTTWKQGRALLEHARALMPLESLVDDVAQSQPARSPGLGAFMSADRTRTPLSLLHYFKHVKGLPQSVVVCSVEFLPVPRVHVKAIGTAESLGEGIWRVTLRFGFMQTPNVPAELRRAWIAAGMSWPDDVSYVIGREHLQPTGPGRLAKWRKLLFMAMSHNVPTATDAFHIPSDRVIELGAQIAL